MKFHSRGRHPSSYPDGTPAIFYTNGGLDGAGCPLRRPRHRCLGRRGTRPCRADRSRCRRLALPGPARPEGEEQDRLQGRRRPARCRLQQEGLALSLQRRILSLWGDVKDLLDGRRAGALLLPPPTAPMSSSTGYANLMPAYYELDDFQVRTPTDIVGQHIHLVKFDVTSSDGAVNGFNYEDGSFSPRRCATGSMGSMRPAVSSSKAR